MPLEKTQKKTTQTTRDQMIDDAIRRTRELMEGRQQPAQPDSEQPKPDEKKNGGKDG
jgi:hypothetical protein